MSGPYATPSSIATVVGGPEPDRPDPAAIGSRLLEDLAALVTRRIWGVITSRQEHEHLNGGYFVAIERAALGLLRSRFVAGSVCIGGRQVAFWTGDQGAEWYASRLTEQVVEILDRPLIHSLVLPLIAIEIPAAIHSAIGVFLEL